MRRVRTVLSAGGWLFCSLSTGCGAEGGAVSAGFERSPFGGVPVSAWAATGGPAAPSSAPPAATPTPLVPALFPPVPARKPAVDAANRLGALGATHHLIPFASNRRVDGRRDFDLYVYDRTLATVWTLPGANTPEDEYTASLSQNNRWLIYVTGRGAKAKIRIYDLWTELVNPLPTLNGDGREHDSPSVDSAGVLLAYTSRDNGRNQMHLFDLRTQLDYVPAAVAKLGTDIHSPAISGDGHYVPFSARGPSGSLDLYLYDVRRATLFSLPFVNTPTDEDEPALSSDNRHLVYWSVEGGHSKLRLADLATGFVDRLPLANSAADQRTPSFLGGTVEAILFDSDRTGVDDRRLYVYELKRGLLDTMPMAHAEVGVIDTLSLPL